MGPTDDDSPLGFLAAHQPMPPDAVLDEALIRRFEEVRRYFAEHPDPRSIPLFLRALPEGSSGFGVYQLLDDVLRSHEPAAVVDELVAALSDNRASYAWMLELALEYSDPRLMETARRLTHSKDPEERLWAETYLAAHDH